VTIVLRSLVVRSGSTTLVNGVALRLASASRTALVGASGAGKSLTCAALAGTLPASLEVAGSLTVEPDAADAGSDPRASSDQADRASGVTLLGLPAARRPRGSRIALVAQDHSTALHPLIAVGRQIALASQAAGRSRDEADERATDYLYAVGLDESFADRVPGRLSGGQRQRVSLALAYLRTGLGLGDVKLGAVIGLWLGWLDPWMLAFGLCIGVFLGGIAALFLLITRRASRKDPMAYGPYLIAGALLTWPLAIV